MTTEEFELAVTNLIAIRNWTPPDDYVDYTPDDLLRQAVQYDFGDGMIYSAQLQQMLTLAEIHKVKFIVEIPDELEGANKISDEEGVSLWITVVPI